MCRETMPETRGTRAVTTHCRRDDDDVLKFFEIFEKRLADDARAATRAVPSDARGMVATNSEDYPFSVRGGRRRQELIKENVLAPMSATAVFQVRSNLTAKSAAGSGDDGSRRERDRGRCDGASGRRRISPWARHRSRGSDVDATPSGVSRALESTD